MALLLAAIIALIPLVIAPGWFFYFDVTPKAVLLLLGTAGAAIWWAVTGGVTGFYRASRAARWFVLALCGMAVSLVISTLASVNPVLSLGGSNWRDWGLPAQRAAIMSAKASGRSCGRLPRWDMRITQPIGCSSWCSPAWLWQAWSTRRFGS